MRYRDHTDKRSAPRGRFRFHLGNSQEYRSSPSPISSSKIKILLLLWSISVAAGSSRKMSGQIFISYRRDDSSASAGRLYDRLSGRFPSNQIFIDVDNIALGVDFVKAIEETVGSCDVLIAVIGKALANRDR